MIFIFTGITFLATLGGGFFAMKFTDKLHLILGFSAGAVIGTVFFSLFPEALLLGGKHFDQGFVLSVSAAGFFVYMLLDRMSLLHSASQEKKINSRGDLGAGSLSLHSLFDGVAIGLSFQISNSIGILIAIAVIVHDFSDGLNTVTIILKNDGSRIKAFKWLLADSLAPVVGVVSTFFFSIPSQIFALVMALFGGFFFYIGTSDLLPESFKTSSYWTTCATILGVTITYFTSRFLT
ncbi:MAG TPA: ZIP family metal transporter [Puia sp.]|nr:ZIP family metal transporter [Puia sp.]